MSEEKVIEEQPAELRPESLWDTLRIYHCAWCNNLIGQLCTMLDSAVDNERKLKALKDIVKQIMWAEHGKQRDACEHIFFSFSKLPEGKLLPEWLEIQLERKA